ncbi:MAG: trehalose-6-phosphate synthase [Steroidobacteraceae bacterium]
MEGVPAWIRRLILLSNRRPFLQSVGNQRLRLPTLSHRAALEQTAGRINGRFSDADWTPIRYLNRDYPHSTLMGLMRAATVCVVTALQDGMNLVAKEFVGAQDPQNPGVLVLSNRTGSAHELSDALIVNPYDLSGVAQAIWQALTMPLAERRDRNTRLLAKLKKERYPPLASWFRWSVAGNDAMRLRSAAPNEL